MSINSDLAAWDEPLLLRNEELLAQAFDLVLASIERGEEIDVDRLLEVDLITSDVEAGQDDSEFGLLARKLIEDVVRIYQAVTTVWHRAGLLDVALQRAGNSEGIMDAVFGATTVPGLPPGEFRIVRKLGEGGFAEVWLADDLNLNRQVALKTVRYRSHDDCSPRALESLCKEAKILAHVCHPNIVQVHAWRQTEHGHYLVLQYVSGGSLLELVREQKSLLWDQAARYIADVSDGLLEVHACGIVHRDIKPANMLWEPQKDEALLTDFGVSARLADARTLCGTPHYMAPEAFQGRASPASDVYSLAASFFHLMTGDVPFRGSNWEEQVRLIRQGLVPDDPRCQVIPESLECVIREGLSPEPECRPPLREFSSAVRGSLNQLLADTMSVPLLNTSHPYSVDLRLAVSRLTDAGSMKPVLSTQPPVASVSRDMKRVPRRPEQVQLRTGDRVRVELASDREGYVVVFNIGPTGNLNLLYPDQLGTVPDRTDVATERPLLVVGDVEMTSPTGRERLFAIWTREPLPLREEELVSLSKTGELKTPTSYEASRDMKRVQQRVQALDRDDWHVVVLELDQQ